LNGSKAEKENIATEIPVLVIFALTGTSRTLSLFSHYHWAQDRIQNGPGQFRYRWPQFCMLGYIRGSKPHQMNQQSWIKLSLTSD